MSSSADLGWVRFHYVAWWTDGTVRTIRPLGDQRSRPDLEAAYLWHGLTPESDLDRGPFVWRMDLHLWGDSVPFRTITAVSWAQLAAWREAVLALDSKAPDVPWH